jgi:hypothetical protein
MRRLRAPSIAGRDAVAAPASCLLARRVAAAPSRALRAQTAATAVAVALFFFLGIIE